jgi:hypothetical protein
MLRMNMAGAWHFLGTHFALLYASFEAKNFADLQCGTDTPMTPHTNAARIGKSENLQMAQQAIAGLAPDVVAPQCGGTSSDDGGKMVWNPPELQQMWVRMMQQAQELT